MPSRKQRRKREKLQRHEYEYVLEDEDGEEESAERLSELDLPKTKRPKEPATPKGQIVDRRGRVVPKPSLERMLRRGAIFAPLVFVFVYITVDETAEHGRNHREAPPSSSRSCSRSCSSWTRSCTAWRRSATAPSRRWSRSPQ